MKKGTYTTYLLAIAGERPSVPENDTTGIPLGTREAYISWLSGIGRDRLREELYTLVQSARNSETQPVDSQWFREMCLREMLKRAFLES